MPDNDAYREPGYVVNDAVMDSIRAKYEVLDRVIKSPAYDGKAIQDEAWTAFLEIRSLRLQLRDAVAHTSSADLVRELHSRIAAEPPTEGTING